MKNNTEINKKITFNVSCYGFGLFEILISMLIFSYCFLSIMNLQVFSWQTSNKAYLSNIAINFAVNSCEAYLANDNNIYQSKLLSEIKNNLPHSNTELSFINQRLQTKICWQNIYKVQTCYILII